MGGEPGAVSIRTFERQQHDFHGERDHARHRAAVLQLRLAGVGRPIGQPAGCPSGGTTHHAGQQWRGVPIPDPRSDRLARVVIESRRC